MRPVVLVVAACSFTPAARGDAQPPSFDADADTERADAPVHAAAPAFALDGMQWEIDCIAALNNGAPTGCTANMTSPSYTRTVALTGMPGQHWTVTLRIAGAMEG